MNKLVYQYDEKKIFKTKLLLDDSDLSPSGNWNIPCDCVEIEPPAEKENTVAVWNGENWQEVEDNRGVEYWLPEDKYGAPARVMKELGALPDGATLTPPKQTQEEKDNIEASAVKNELQTLAVNAMMMSLAGDDLWETKNTYQTKLRSISDGVALKVPELFPHWSGNSKEYVKDDKVLYNDVLYKVLQNHTSQKEWTPTSAPSLFAKVLTSEGEILDWEQPDSTNPYMKGDKVRYNGKVYESLIDNNVWSPDAYPLGWKEIEEA